MYEIHWDGWQSFFSAELPLNFWNILNSPFLTTVLIGGIAVWFQRRIEVGRALAQIQKRADDRRRETAKASQRIVEKAVVPADVDQRDVAREKVKLLKTQIDQRIQADPDGRHHRVYGSLSRHDYIVRAEALFDRDQIDEAQMERIASALSAWNQYAVGRASKKKVPRDVVLLIEEALSSMR